jgi:hypothetical protein
MILQSSSRKRRPLVSEEWMTHPNTPFVTERLVDGRIRSVARTQNFQETDAQEEQRMHSLYGGRWAGIRHFSAIRPGGIGIPSPGVGVTAFNNRLV